MKIYSPKKPAKSLLGMYRCNLSQGTTRFYHFGTDTVGVTEALTQAALPKGKFSMLKVYVDQNVLNVACEVVVRVNGADTALILTIPKNTTGVFTIKASVSISEDDLCCFSGRVPIGAGNINFHPLAVFEPD